MADVSGRLVPPRGVFRMLWLGLTVIALASTASASDYAGAFLEAGMSGRSLGITGVVTAAADDAAAAMWNPAALSRIRGARLMAVTQPESSDAVDRGVSGLAAAWNSRGGLGFGFAWISAGVGELLARNGSGQILGDIDNGQNALFFALGLPLNDKLSVGFAVKILSEDLDTPQLESSSATGRGLDLGIDYQLNPQTRLAATVRNLAARMSWSVERASQQTSRSEDNVPVTATLGIAHTLWTGLSVAADIASSSIGTDVDTRAEWRVSPLLSLRAGLDRLNDSLQTTTFGLTLKPMQIETLQFHFAYLTDELDAGSTTAFGLSTSF